MSQHFNFCTMFLWYIFCDTIIRYIPIYSPSPALLCLLVTRHLPSVTACTRQRSCGPVKSSSRHTTLAVGGQSCVSKRCRATERSPVTTFQSNTVLALFLSLGRALATKSLVDKMVSTWEEYFDE